MKRAARWFVAMGVFATVAAFVPPDAWSKAKDFKGRKVETIEAIVMRVLKSEAIGDADYNLIIRPIPGKEKEFWKKFWYPEEPLWASSKNRIEYLREQLDKIKSNDWSNECRQYAGSEVDQCRGLMDPSNPPAENPCPKVFSNHACLMDVERATGESLTRFAPEAEIFMGSDDSELNENLENAMSALDAGCSGGGGTHCCVDYSWGCPAEEKDQQENCTKGKRYYVPTDYPAGICGKRVIFSGLVTMERNHDAKPEIHPVLSMVVDQEGGKYLMGTFIDGSHPPPKCPWYCYAGQLVCGIVSAAVSVASPALAAFLAAGVGCFAACCAIAYGVGSIWMYEYRTELSETEYPSTATIDLFKLLKRYQAQPTEESSTGASGTTTTKYEPSCVWGALFSYNVADDYPKANATSTGTKSTAEAKACPAVEVKMNRQSSYGAAWVGEVQTQWRKMSYTIGLTAKLETPGGVLAVDPTVSAPMLVVPIGKVSTSAQPSGQRQSVTAVALPLTAAAIGRSVGTGRTAAVGADRTVVTRAPAVSGVAVQKAAEKVPTAWLSPRLASVAADPACEVRTTAAAGTTVQGLRRWYRWSVTAKASFPSLEFRSPTFDWSYYPDKVIFVPNPADEKKAWTQTSFSVWLPVRLPGEKVAASEPSEGNVGWVLAKLNERSASNVLQTSEVASHLVELRAPVPSVTISASGEKVATQAQGLSYTLQLSAKARGFCQGGYPLRYEWFSYLKGQARTKMATVTGTGPFTVTLEPGEEAIYEVVVTDPWNVQYAQAVHVLKAPTLQVHLATKCNDGQSGELAAQALTLDDFKRQTRTAPLVSKASVVTYVPTKIEPSDSTASYTKVLCNELVVAAAAYTGKGVGASYPSVTLQGLKFTWSDLVHSTSTSAGKWTAIPSSWMQFTKFTASGWQKVEKLPGGLKIASEFPLHGEQIQVLAIRPPDPVPEYEFTASVTAKDPWGRSASAEVYGSNEITPPGEIKSLVQNIWKKLLLKAKVPVGPTPRATSGLTGDPLERILESLLLDLSTGAKGWYGREALRGSLRAFRNLASAKAAKLSGLKHTLPSVPAFTVAATKGVDRYQLMGVAQQRAREGLRLDAAFRQRFGSTLLRGASFQKGQKLQPSAGTKVLR